MLRRAWFFLLSFTGLLFAEVSIEVESPLSSAVSTPYVEFKGRAKSDTEIKSIEVGPVSLGVWGKQVPFSVPVQLKEGLNEVNITAYDNQGNQATKIVRVSYQPEGQPPSTPQRAKEKPTPPAKPKPLPAETSPPKGAPAPLPKAELPAPIQPAPSTGKESLSDTTGAPKEPETKGVNNVPPKAQPRVKVKKQQVKLGPVAAPRVKRTVHEPSKLSVQVSNRRRVQILVQGKPVGINPHPVIVSGRTMVPISEEAITESIDFQLVKSSEKGKLVVYLIHGGQRVKFVEGESYVEINGKKQAMEVRPFLQSEEGRLMVPIRYAAEGMGFKVGWEHHTKTVLVT